jgi:predicted nucleic acid-binding protein
VIILDASAAIEWLLRTGKGLRIEAEIFTRHTLHAPHLLDVEIAHALRRYTRDREVTEAGAKELLQTFTDLRIVRHGHMPLLGRVWELRHNLTAYDAIYIALAEFLAVPVLTCDAKVASAQGHLAVVELV